MQTLEGYLPQKWHLPCIGFWGLGVEESEDIEHLTESLIKVSAIFPIAVLLRGSLTWW